MLGIVIGLCESSSGVVVGDGDSIRPFGVPSCGEVHRHERGGAGHPGQQEDQQGKP